MLEHLIQAAAQPRFQRNLLVFALLIGTGSFAQHNGRALLLSSQSPNAFAAVAQNNPPSIASLQNQGDATPAAPRATGRRGGGSADPVGDRPTSFGVAGAEPLEIAVNGSPSYRPEIRTPPPISLAQAPSFVAPEDILPTAGGGAGNQASVNPTPPAVPEPSSLMLAAFGMLLLGGIAWRRGRQPLAR